MQLLLAHCGTNFKLAHSSRATLFPSTRLRPTISTCRTLQAHSVHILEQHISVEGQEIVCHNKKCANMCM